MRSTAGPNVPDVRKALRSLEYKEYIGELIKYLRFAARRLQDGQPEGSSVSEPFTDEVALVIETLADCLDPTARSTYSLILSKRGRGRPAGEKRIAPPEARALKIVLERPNKEKLKVGISLAMEATRLSRARIFDVLRRHRERQEILEDAIEAGMRLAMMGEKTTRLISREDLKEAVRRAVRVQRKSLK